MARDRGRTRAVPPAALPVVAPVQYRLPTIKRTTQMNVWHELMIVRRPNLSVDKHQIITARRLQQLKSRLAMYVHSEGVCRWHLACGSRENNSAEEGIVQTGEGEEVYTISGLRLIEEERIMQRTGRVGADDSETSKLLGDGQYHHRKGTFLILV